MLKNVEVDDQNVKGVDIVDKIDKEKSVKIIDLFGLKNPPPEYYEKNIKVAFFFIIKKSKF